MAKKTQLRHRLWSDWKIGTKVAVIVLAVTFLSIAVLVSVNYVLNSNQTAQQVGDQLVTLSEEVILRAADQVFAELKNLQTLAQTPLLVDAVKATNLERAALTEAEIQSLDKAWIDNSPSLAPTVYALRTNELTQYLQEFLKNNPNQVEIFVTDVKGLNLAMTDKTSDFLQSDEGWWSSTYAEGQGNPYIASVEFDESTRTYAMNLGVPVLDPLSKKVVGVLRGTLDVSFLIQTLGNVTVGETGHALLLDSDGNILFSPDPEFVMQIAPPEMLALFESGQNGWTKGVELHGHPSIIAYSQLPEELGNKLDWHILMVQEQDEVNQVITRSLLVSMLAGIIMAVVGILLALTTIRLITNPIKKMTDTFNLLATGDLDLKGQDPNYIARIEKQQDEVGGMYRAGSNLLVYLRDMVSVAQRVAKGDLTVQAEARSNDDQLGFAFTKMITELRNLISEVASSAKNVKEASENLTESATQASRATEQISVTIQEMARGTNQHAATITHTTQSVEQMSTAIEGVARGAQEQANAVNQATQIAGMINSTIREVANKAQESARAASDAADTARTGAKTVEDTITGMNSIKSKVGVSVEKVQEMGERSSQIGTIIQTIEDISSQTNLLALNAAIEAARAGEHGKGFAVVADEVRKLAERSSSATKEIGGLISGIQVTVAEAVTAMNAGASEVESGVERASQSGVALQSILSAVESVNSQITSIADSAQNINNSAIELDNSMSSVSAVVEENTAATEQMTAGSTEVTSAMEVIASTSEETSAAIQEVSASTEEMTAQVNEVTDSANTLAGLADTLQSMVLRFKLEEGSDSQEE
jgi:methyl-accepting chemotaxis protein